MKELVQQVSRGDTCSSHQLDQKEQGGKCTRVEPMCVITFFIVWICVVRPVMFFL